MAWPMRMLLYTIAPQNMRLPATRITTGTRYASRSRFRTGRDFPLGRHTSAAISVTVGGGDVAAARGLQPCYSGNGYNVLLY
ncbi:hypothetical protein QTP88_007777 [Uroleucon formosanum]